MWPLHSDLEYFQVLTNQVSSKWEWGMIEGKKAWYCSNTSVPKGGKHWNDLFQGINVRRGREKFHCHLDNSQGILGAKYTHHCSLSVPSEIFFIFMTYLWLTPLIILVGDQRGSWAVRITPRRNWFGFCTSGWVEVSVWLRVYSWSQATRRIWNYISGKGWTSTNT